MKKIVSYIPSVYFWIGVNIIGLPEVFEHSFKQEKYVNEKTYFPKSKYHK